MKIKIRASEFARQDYSVVAWTLIKINALRTINAWDKESVKAKQSTFRSKNILRNLFHVHIGVSLTVVSITGYFQSFKMIRKEIKIDSSKMNFRPFTHGQIKGWTSENVTSRCSPRSSIEGYNQLECRRVMFGGGIATKHRELLDISQ